MDNIAQINAVAGLAAQMAEQSTTSINAVTSIAVIIEDNLASVQEISATSEQQSSMMTKVSGSAENLNQIAAKLNESIAVFQLKREVDEQESGKMENNPKMFLKPKREAFG